MRIAVVVLAVCLSIVGMTESDEALADASAADTPAETSKESQLQEVIVTAEKRTERLLDVPVPVTAIEAPQLTQNNQFRLQDYFSQVPGLIATPHTQVGYDLSIRGITTGAGTNPTVGVMVDDIPYGSSTSYGLGTAVPDIDPGDLARVEVLRGPQGTLYGASSMGGLIKFVTVDPSTAALTGQVQAGMSTVENGPDLGYNFRGSANIPVADTFAVRMSAFTRLDPGYIDNPALHEEGLGDERVSGGRIAALWQPVDNFTLRLSALYQTYSANDTQDVNPALGGLNQNYLPGVGAYDGNAQAYSATATLKFSNMTLTSLTGYNVRTFNNSLDVSQFFNPQSLYGVSGASLVSPTRTDKFSQEIRLTGPLGEHFDYVVGGFYTYEDSARSQSILAVNPSSGAVIANTYDNSFPSTYAETAGFADLTVHATSAIDIQVGGRWSSIRQEYLPDVTVEPLFANGSTVPNVAPASYSSATPFTYLLTPSFKLTPDLLLYARFASGFRAGGSNGSFCTVYHYQCEFAPDKTENYELGTKGELLDHRVSFDASAYYINWSDIQLSAVTTNQQGYETNASSAKSEGLELSLNTRPLTGLTVSAWVVWNEAALTAPLPQPSYGSPGDMLPYSARFSGNLSIEQDFPVTGNITGFVGGSVFLLGNRLGNFTGSANTPRVDLPGYGEADVRLGGQYTTWTVNFFVNNVFDRRGVLNAGNDLFPPATIYILPRTAGLNVQKSF